MGDTTVRDTGSQYRANAARCYEGAVDRLATF
jgi:hypothetical protein